MIPTLIHHFNQNSFIGHCGGIACGWDSRACKSRRKQSGQQSTAWPLGSACLSEHGYRRSWRAGQLSVWTGGAWLGPRRQRAACQGLSRWGGQGQGGGRRGGHIKFSQNRIDCNRHHIKGSGGWSRKRREWIAADRWRTAAGRRSSRWTGGPPGSGGDRASTAPNRMPVPGSMSGVTTTLRAKTGVTSQHGAQVRGSPSLVNMRRLNIMISLVNTR